MNIKYISNQRTNIMGIAIVLIILFHTDIHYTHSIDMIKNFGDFGVNIFYAISGFSMCFAWDKNPHTLSFYRNRLLRIGITLLPISITWNLLSYLAHETSALEALFKILTIQFWIDGNLLQWFISGIIVFYLITPLWMKLYQINQKLCLVLTVALCLVCFSQPITLFLYYIRIFVQRVPSYFIGLYLGKQLINGKPNAKWASYLTAFLLVIGIVGFALIGFNTRNYIWKYTLYTILTFPLLMIISYLLECKYSSSCKPILTFLGGITLEIYLLQEKILKIIHILLNKINITLDSKNIILNVMVISLTISIGYFYNKICSNAYKKLRK